MTDTRKQHGHFSWNELTTPDVEGAQAFYGEMFGWSFEQMSPGGMDYTVANIGDEPVAGLMGIPEDGPPMPPMWGAYITVDDVDAAVTKLESLGGKVLVPPMDVPEVGRFCVFSDPQGVVLSIIKYSEDCDS